MRPFLFHLFLYELSFPRQPFHFGRRTAHDSALDELVVVNFGRHENDVVRDIHLSRRHGIVFLLPRATSSSIRVVSPRLAARSRLRHAKSRTVGLVHPGALRMMTTTERRTRRENNNKKKDNNNKKKKKKKK